MHYYVNERGVKVCKVCELDWHGEGRWVTEAADCYSELRRVLLRHLVYLRRNQATRDTFATWQVWSEMNWLLHRRDIALTWLTEASAAVRMDDRALLALGYAAGAVREARLAVAEVRRLTSDDMELPVDHSAARRNVGSV